MKTFRKIFIICICILLILIAVASATFLIVTKDSKLNEKKLTSTQASITICDVYGIEITQISNSKATKSVKIQELPEHLKSAFVSIEDKNFYKHNGLDYLRIGKAFFKNMKSHSYKEGASTISQQLIKNTHLSNEKTITRKLKEIRLTKQLERKYTKDEIMEMYLNTIYFGHNCFGIESASDYYFGKKSENLNIAESALLAALIKAPNNYSPFNNPEKCLSRRNLVISKMLEYGYINKSQAEKAKSVPLPKKENSIINAQTYIKCVYNELESALSFSPYSFLDECKIYTFMDQNTQKYVENLKTTADRSGKSIIIIDNKTRGITAFYSTEGNEKRLPGSILKPLAVYTPAIEENIIVPCSPILDEKTNFSGYTPSNFGGNYSGYVSARYALSQSLNIPAVKILNCLGIDNSEKYLKKLNLDVCESDKSLSLALGGMSRGYTLDKLTGAYTVFSNNGYYAAPRFISKIEDKNGNLLYKSELAPSKVFSAATVAMINDMLYEAAKNGTAKKLANLTFDVCAKTGTNGTDKGNTDAYTISYTPENTIGVWMGNYDNEITDIVGGGLPCHYSYLINKELYKNRSISKFTLPNDIVSLKLDKEEYDKNHKIVLADEYAPNEYVFSDIFKASYLPKEKSEKFSNPNIKTPNIYYKNNAVYIELCQAEYYYYQIKRQNNDTISVIYDGKYATQIKDDDIQKNQKYTYTVTPYTKSSTGKVIFGRDITLPTVFTKSNNSYNKILDEIIKI